TTAGLVFMAIASLKIDCDQPLYGLYRFRTQAKRWRLMMRVSRIQAAENRQSVINAASRLFREHGFDGIRLKDLMEGAGLTQGAFYKQFASKEDLAAQASKPALESASSRPGRGATGRR